MNLLTLDEDEYQTTIKEYSEYLVKHRHYKHYRDQEKILTKPCFYTFPVGKAYRERFEKMLSLSRRYTIPSYLEDLKKDYGCGMPKIQEVEYPLACPTYYRDILEISKKGT